MFPFLLSSEKYGTAADTKLAILFFLEHFRGQMDQTSTHRHNTNLNQIGFPRNHRTVKIQLQLGCGCVGRILKQTVGNAPHRLIDHCRAAATVQGTNHIPHSVFRICPKQIFSFCFIGSQKSHMKCSAHRITAGFSNPRQTRSDPLRYGTNLTFSIHRQPSFAEIMPYPIRKIKINLHNP